MLIVTMKNDMHMVDLGGPWSIMGTYTDIKLKIPGDDRAIELVEKKDLNGVDIGFAKIVLFKMLRKSAALDQQPYGPRSAIFQVIDLISYLEESEEPAKENPK